MVGEEQVDEQLGPIPGSEVPRLELDRSQRLIGLGFDPQATVYVIQGGFDQSMIVDAMFEGLRSQPRPIPFSYRYGDYRDQSAITLPMEVELVQVVWVHYQADNGTRHVDDRPEWYIRGWLGQCEINPDHDSVRMHAYVGTLDEPACPSTAYLQMLREQPTKAPAFSLDGLLVVDDRAHPPVLD